MKTDASAQLAKPASRIAPAMAASILAFITPVTIAAATEPEIVAAFDPARLETPEGIAIDAFGNKYVSLALTGEIRRIDRHGRQRSLASLPIGATPLTPCSADIGFVGIIGNLDVDFFGNTYVGVHSCDAGATGVYRVSHDGRVTKLAGLPPAAQPNGVEFHQGQVYVTDSFFGRIWRVPAAGGAAVIWSDAALLKARPEPMFPAANGLQLFRGSFYVSVPDTGRIVRVPLRANGEAGVAVIHANAACDDFALDVFGNLFCGTDPFNTVLRISPNGDVETLLDIDDGLDGPTAVAFGRSIDDLLDIYITNAAFPFFPNQQRPSLLRYRVDSIGAP